jgi:hypothetical protein
LNVFDAPADCTSRVTSVSTSGNAKIHTSDAARFTAAFGSALGGAGAGAAGEREQQALRERQALPRSSRARASPIYHTKSKRIANDEDARKQAAEEVIGVFRWKAVSRGRLW